MNVTTDTPELLIVESRPVSLAIGLVVLHRPEANVELRRHSLFGASRVRYGLDEIDRAEVEESRSSESGSTYRVVPLIERGQSVGRHPVTLAYSSGSAHHIAADKINRWLEAAR